MACRVIRNNDGKIEQVLDANGIPDPLFDQILTKINQNFSIYNEESFVKSVFPNTKVKQIVYRAGSINSEEFSESPRDHMDLGSGYYFSPKKSVASEYGTPRAIIVNIENPKDVKIAEQERVDYGQSGNLDVPILNDDGKVDGIIDLEDFKNSYEGVVFDRKQIYILSEEELKKINQNSNSPIREGVPELFESNPELANIGTQEQYSQYLDTIFPDSNVKDIVYHGSEQQFEKFLKEKLSQSPVIHFSKKKDWTGWYKFNYPVLLNIKKLYDYGWLDRKEKENDTNLPAIEGAVLDNFNESDLERLSKQGYDGAFGYGQITYEKGIPTDNLEYVVFEPEQIHILGSKQDIEGFNEFANESPQVVSQDLNIPQLKSIVESRGRDKTDAKELALVMYAQELANNSEDTSIELPVPEVKGTKITIGDKTITPSQYANNTVYKEDIPLDPQQLEELGNLVVDKGNELVVRGNPNNSSWLELADQGKAYWDNIAEEWIFIPADLSLAEPEDSKADKAAKAFFKKAGVKLQSVEELGSANALIDTTKMLVQVVEGKRNAYTLPEEAAHLAVAMLSDSELYSLLQDIVNTPEYTEVKANYEYDTENQYRREAIGKKVAQELVNKSKQGFFIRLLNYLSRKISKVVGYFNKNVSRYSSIADMIMLGDVRDIIDKNVYYQQSTITQQEIVDKLDAMTDLFDNSKPGNGYKLKNGQVNLKRVSDTVNKIRDRLFRAFASEVNIEELNEQAIFGTIGHMYQELLMSNIDIQNRDSSHTFSKEGILSEVKSNLRTHPDFANLPDSTFDIGLTNYNELKNFSINLHKRLMLDPNTVLRFEQKIFNKDLNEAGTMDLIAIDSKGVVSIVDYKFKTNFLNDDKMNRLSGNDRILYSSQIGRYKSHLADVVGVTHFGETVIAPIAVSTLASGRKSLTAPYISGNATVRDLPTLEPVANQLVISLTDKFNNKLSELITERTRLSLELKNNPGDFILKNRLYDLNEAIINLQLYKNPDHLLKLLERDINLADKATDMTSWTNAYKTLSLFEDMDIALAPVIDDYAKTLNLSEDDKNTLIKRASGLVFRSREQLDLLINKFIEWHSMNGSVDFKDDYESKTGLSALFDGFDEDKSPTHRRARELVNAATVQTKKEFEAIRAEMNEAFEKLKLELGTGLSMFDPIINKKTGNLISKVSERFYSDMKELSGQDLIDFKQEHFEFNKEAYDRYEAKVIEGNVGNVNLDRILDEFRNKNNPEYNDQAWLTSRYVRIDYDNLAQEYVSTEYAAIQNKPGVVEYLKLYNRFMYMLSVRSGKNFNGNFIPETPKALLERFFSTGFKGNIRSMHEHLQSIPDDPLFGAIRAGIVEDRVPFYFTAPLLDPLSDKEKLQIKEQVDKDSSIPDNRKERETENRIKKLEREKGIAMKTRDVHKAFLQFAETTLESINKKEIEDAVNSLKHILAERGNDVLTDKEGNGYISQATNTVVKLLGVTHATQERFDKLLKVHLYNQYIQSDDVKVGKYSGTKLAKMLMKYQGLKSVAFNPLLALANSTNSLFSTIAFWKEELYFTKDIVMESAKLFYQRDIKAMTILDYFYKGDKESRSKSIDARKLISDASASKALQKLTLGNVYAMHRIPNEMLSRVLFLSIIKNYYLDGKQIKKITDGQQSIYDQFDIEKALNLPEDVTNLIEGKINTLHNKIMNRTLGEASQDQINQFSTTILGQLLMHFRNWLPGMAKARFIKYKYDEVTDVMDVGRLRVLIEEISRGWKEGAVTISQILFRDMFNSGFLENNLYSNKEVLQEEVNKINKLNGTNMQVSDLIELRKNKLNAAAFDLRVLASVIILIQLAAALDWDDEDAGPLSQFAYRASKRAYLELSFFVNPASAIQIISSPFTMIREVSTVGKILTNGFQESAELIGLIPENKKDSTPLGYHTSKNIPLFNILLQYTGYYKSPQEKELIEYFFVKP
jgi:hypothetical protein